MMAAVFRWCVSEVELKIHLRDGQVKSCRDVFVNAEEGATSLTVKVKSPYGPLVTLLETNHLYDKIKPAETIWYIDEDQLVINLKKHDADLKWPDIVESWESLTIGAVRLLKGSSLYIVGESNELNQIVARELAVGLGLQLMPNQISISGYTGVIAEGMDSVAKAEGAILESLSSHVRAVIATLGGEHGAAFDANKWQHLYSGFTIWLSPSETTDDIRAKEEARRQIENGSGAYSNADVVVKMRGWDHHHAQTVAQACLSALKKLILSDKTLPGITLSSLAVSHCFLNIQAFQLGLPVFAKSVYGKGAVRIAPF
ncbi:hypothetical protein IFM89_017876, partial [Coptis chinensis]